MYFAFFKQAIKTRWAYRINNLFGMIGTVLKIVASLYLWRAIFNSSNASSLGGFTIDEMYTYLIIASIVALALGSSIDFTVPYEIKEGFIAMELIKPYSYIKRHFFGELGNLATNILVSSFIFLTYLIYTQNIAILVSINFIFFLISLVLSYLITFSFNMIVALVAFYTNYIWGIRMIKNTLISFLSGALIPLSFLPSIFEKILVYSPFSYLSYYPTLIFMGKLTKVDIFKSLLIQGLWVAIFILAMQTFYKKAIKNLQILGG